MGMANIPIWVFAMPTTSLVSSPQLKTFDMDVLTTALAAPKCVIRALKLFVADVARLIERHSHRSMAWPRYLDFVERVGFVSDEEVEQRERE